MSHTYELRSVFLTSSIHEGSPRHVGKRCHSTPHPWGGAGWNSCPLIRAIIKRPHILCRTRTTTTSTSAHMIEKTSSMKHKPSNTSHVKMVIKQPPSHACINTHACTCTVKRLNIFSYIHISCTHPYSLATYCFTLHHNILGTICAVVIKGEMGSLKLIALSILNAKLPNEY